MIVCHCRAVTDRAIRQAVRNGARTRNDVVSACAANMSCGGCTPAVNKIIEAEHAAHKRTAEQVKELEGIYSAFTRQAPNTEIKIHSHDKDITSLYHRDDGSLWILSSTGSRG